MEPVMQLNDSGDVVRTYDANNRDVLFCRRAEIFFTPNEDGTASTEGKVVWHTEWWNYIGTIKRGETLGPRLENTIAEVLGASYDLGLPDPLPAALIVTGVKAAFVARAASHFGIGQVEDAPIEEPGNGE